MSVILSQRVRGGVEGGRKHGTQPEGERKCTGLITSYVTILITAPFPQTGLHDSGCTDLVIDHVASLMTVMHLQIQIYIPLRPYVQWGPHYFPF